MKQIDYFRFNFYVDLDKAAQIIWKGKRVVFYFLFLGFIISFFFIFVKNIYFNNNLDPAPSKFVEKEIILKNELQPAKKKAEVVPKQINIVTAEDYQSKWKALKGTLFELGSILAKFHEQKITEVSEYIIVYKGLNNNRKMIKIPIAEYSDSFEANNLPEYAEVFVKTRLISEEITRELMDSYKIYKMEMNLLLNVGTISLYDENKIRGLYTSLIHAKDRISKAANVEINDPMLPYSIWQVARARQGWVSRNIHLLFQLYETTKKLGADLYKIKQKEIAEKKLAEKKLAEEKLAEEKSMDNQFVKEESQEILATTAGQQNNFTKIELIFSEMKKINTYITFFLGELVTFILACIMLLYRRRDWIVRV